DRAFQRLQDGERVAAGDRDRRDAREDLRLPRIDPPRPGERGPPRRQRIARDDEVEDGGAALDVAVRAPRALREYVSANVAVLRRVAVEDDGGRAPALRLQRLAAAVAVEVARQDDAVFDRDAGPGQPFEVLREREVGVDHLTRQVAGGR